MAEVRIIDRPAGAPWSPSAVRTFTANPATAVQVLLKGPFRLVRIDGDEDMPEARRLTIVDADDTVVEIFGDRDDIEMLTVERSNFG